jgi:hypothetical protein
VCFTPNGDCQARRESELWSLSNIAKLRDEPGCGAACQRRAAPRLSNPPSLQAVNNRLPYARLVDGALTLGTSEAQLQRYISGSMSVHRGRAELAGPRTKRRVTDLDNRAPFAHRCDAASTVAPTGVDGGRATGVEPSPPWAASVVLTTGPRRYIADAGHHG